MCVSHRPRPRALCRPRHCRVTERRNCPGSRSAPSLQGSKLVHPAAYAGVCCWPLSAPATHRPLGRWLRGPSSASIGPSPSRGLGGPFGGCIVTPPPQQSGDFKRPGCHRQTPQKISLLSPPDISRPPLLTPTSRPSLQPGPPAAAAPAAATNTLAVKPSRSLQPRRLRPPLARSLWPPSLASPGPAQLRLLSRALPLAQPCAPPGLARSRAWAAEAAVVGIEAAFAAHRACRVLARPSGASPLREQPPTTGTHLPLLLPPSASPPAPARRRLGHPARPCHPPSPPSSSSCAAAPRSTRPPCWRE